VTRPVLYDHFPSKKALYLSLLERETALLLEHVAARILGEGAHRERMRNAVDAFLSFVETHPLAWQMLSRQGAGDPEIAAADDRLRARSAEAIRTLLAADLIAVGVDPAGRRAEILVEVAGSAVEGIARWSHHHPSVPRDELVDVVTELLWGGLERLFAEP
jgi:AcrR family transcriptional regulator